MSTEDQPQVRTIESMSAAHLQRRLAGVAARLRDIAERVERTAKDVDKVGQSRGWTSYAQAATDAQHEVLWGLANLSLDGLTSAAEEADRARVAGVAGRKIAEEIEATVVDYPDNEVERPKVEPGLYVNDGQWAAQVARGYAQREG